MRYAIRLVWILPVALVLLLWGCAKPVLNRPAPAFKANIISGGTGTIDNAKVKGMPTVINFWASWCGPCRLELPIFDDLAAKKYKGRVNFIAVDTGDKKVSALRFIEEERIKMRVAFDQGDEIARKFAVTSLPTTIILDDRGYVVDRMSGGLDADTLTAALDSVLREAERAKSK